MHDNYSSQRELEAELRERVIPWMRGGLLHFVLARFPLQISAPVRSTPLPRVRLQRVTRRRASLPIHSAFAAQWPEEHLCALPFLQIGCVLEGHADLKIAPPREFSSLKRNKRISAGRNDDTPGAQSGRGACWLHLPVQSFFVFPPGLPCSDGAQAHYCGDDIESAFARIMWIGFLPEGVIIHICTTRGRTHSHPRRLILIDSHAPRVADLFLDACRRAQDSARDAPSEIAMLHLQALLLRVEELLRSPRAATSSAATVLHETRHSPGNASSSVIVKRACDYIEDHLNQRLDATQIAARVYVSPSHLNTLFRAELQTSVMRYVTARRVEAARSLLLNTDLSITEISRHLGFRHTSHFSSVFTSSVGTSPREFRERHGSGGIRQQ